MAGVVVVAAGTGEVAVATTVTNTIQSSAGCRSARTAFVRAADNAVVEPRSERNPGAKSSSLVDHPSTGGSDKTSTRCADSSPSSPETQTRCGEDRTDHTQPVVRRVSPGGRPTSLNGAPGCKSPRSESPVQSHDEEKEASRTSRSSELQTQSLLPQDLVVVENGGSSEASSVGSTTSPSTLSLPPVVPVDMAEAIKRQKGTGNVRYWKTKHLQSGRNQVVPLNKSGTGGGFRSAMLPVLKPPPSLHGSGSGPNGNAAAAAPGATLRMTKAKERLIRQRGKENGLGDLRRSIHNKINSTTGQAPVYHTQYMYGHGLGEYPPPPAAYRRSVDALENFLSLPLPTSLPHPAPHRLTPSSSLNLTDPTTRPNPAALTLTQLSPQESAREGPPPSSSDAPEDLSLQDDHPDLQGRALGRLVERGQGDLAGVADLTCLQLADAILGTRSADLSQYYQICQTKIRYVDFLERSATFRALDPSPHPTTTTTTTTTKPPTSKAQPSPLLHHPSTPRLHTWVPGLDLQDTHLPDDVTAPGGDASPPRHNNDGDSSSTDSGRKEKKAPHPPVVTLPSLVAPASGVGMKMSHGLPPSAGTKSFLSICNDAELGSKTSPRTSNVFPGASSSTGLHLPTSSLAAIPSGKPILKPFNPDAIPVKIQRSYDPFSPRSVYSDLTGTSGPAPLSVRGTTMYPMSTAEGGRAEISGEVVGAHSRRSQSSKSRKEAELRKRAVRFSISDQVYEFAPGEPLVP